MMDKLTDPVCAAPGCPWVPAGSWIQIALGQWQGSCPCLCYPFGKAVTGLQSICSEQILARSLDQAESAQVERTARPSCWVQLGRKEVIPHRLFSISQSPEEEQKSCRRPGTQSVREGGEGLHFS